MRVRPRRRPALAWWPLLPAVALACSTPARAPEPDFDSGWTSEPEPGAPPPVAPRVSLLPEERRTRWEHADALAAMTLLPGRGRSEHLGGEYLREVLVNPPAQAYAGKPSVASWPSGAIIAQRHLTADSRTVGYFVMQRTQRSDAAVPTAWRYLVLDPQLRIATATSPESCKRCHHDAPGDGVFGPPTAEPPNK